MSSVPTGWASDRLKDVAAINAIALSAGTDLDYEFDYLEISNVDYHGIVDPNAIEHLRFEDAPSRARRRVAAGSTVISSVRPNLQAVAFFPDAPAHFGCSTGFNIVEPQPSRLSPQFASRRIKPEGAKIVTPTDLLPHIRHYADRKQEQMVQQYVRTHGRITRREAAELCRLSPDQAKRLLLHLVGQGTLRAHGERKGRFYNVPPNNMGAPKSDMGAPISTPIKPTRPSRRGQK